VGLGRIHPGTKQSAELPDSRCIRRKRAQELDVGASVDSVERLPRGKIQFAVDDEEVIEIKEVSKVKEL